MNWERGTWNSELETRNRKRQRRSFFVVPSSEFRAPRSAFTLFEITLVLALLVTIAAIAWPALDGVFANERLKKTADQLRSDLIKARVAAMNTGCCHLFSWDPTSGHYFVVAIDERSSDPFSPPSNLGGANSLPVLSRHLPDGITLVSIVANDDVTPPPPTSELTATLGNADGSSRNVFFHPDGTTSSALVTLASDGQLFVDVRLRGLTGGTAVGEVVATTGAR